MYFLLELVSFPEQPQIQAGIVKNANTKFMFASWDDLYKYVRAAIHSYDVSFETFQKLESLSTEEGYRVVGQYVSRTKLGVTQGEFRVYTASQGADLVFLAVVDKFGKTETYALLRDYAYYLLSTLNKNALQTIALETTGVAAYALLKDFLVESLLSLRTTLQVDYKLLDLDLLTFIERNSVMFLRK